MAALSEKSEYFNPPKGGWTVGKLISCLSKFPTETKVHVLSHSDFGAHNVFGVGYEPLVLRDAPAEDKKGPLIILD